MDIECKLRALRGKPVLDDDVLYMGSRLKLRPSELNRRRFVLCGRLNDVFRREHTMTGLNAAVYTELTRFSRQTDSAPLPLEPHDARLPYLRLSPGTSLERAQFHQQHTWAVLRCDKRLTWPTDLMWLMFHRMLCEPGWRDWVRTIPDRVEISDALFAVMSDAFTEEYFEDGELSKPVMSITLVSGGEGVLLGVGYTRTSIPTPVSFIRVEVPLYLLHSLGAVLEGPP